MLLEILKLSFPGFSKIKKSALFGLDSPGITASIERNVPLDNKRIFRKISLMLLVISLVLSGCHDQVRKRPIGWMRLGPLKDFLAEETYLSEQRLMVRRDSAGFSVMSTMCTYDLSALRRVVTGDTYIWTSTLTDSKYHADGTVLSGPATAALPYYELRIDALVHGGPVDTLYVQIGIEKDKSWRRPFDLGSPESG